MEIVIISKKPVIDDRYGRLAKDTKIDLPDHKAMFYIQRGEAVRYETKVLQENPYTVAGATEQQSALPAAQALPQTTLSALENGGKRRGRKARL